MNKEKIREILEKEEKQLSEVLSDYEEFDEMYSEEIEKYEEIIAAFDKLKGFSANVNLESCLYLKKMYLGCLKEEQKAKRDNLSELEVYEEQVNHLRKILKVI